MLRRTAGADEGFDLSDDELKRRKAMMIVITLFLILGMTSSNYNPPDPTSDVPSCEQVVGTDYEGPCKLSAGVITGD